MHRCILHLGLDEHLLANVSVIMFFLSTVRIERREIIDEQDRAYEESLCRDQAKVTV